jgi:hypothetical protein
MLRQTAENKQTIKMQYPEWLDYKFIQINLQLQLLKRVLEKHSSNKIIVC